MHVTVTWSWPIFLDAMVTLAVLAMPLGAEAWQDALKAWAGLAFSGIGAGILFSDLQGDILVTALLLLAAGLVSEALAAVGPGHRPWFLLAWASNTLVIAASPWDELIAWVNDTRRWLAIITLLAVGHLTVMAARKHLRSTEPRPDPHDHPDP